MGLGASIFGLAGPALNGDERAFFRAAQPFGFILFARNIVDPDQVRALCADLRDLMGRDAPILIDQEGGRVQRLTPPHWRAYAPPLDQFQPLDDAAACRAAWLRGRLIAAELFDLGIDTNCAPCADIATEQTHPFLKNRCYGFDAERVSDIANALAQGQAAGGVLSVLKHMPGHGRAVVDSHHDLPRVDTERAALFDGDFAPFGALADLPFAMTGHIVFSDIDPDQPVTLSAPMIELIRDQIGFQNCLMSDDISMQALRGDIGERARLAQAAGCDLVLHCNGVMAQMQAVADALSPLAGGALRRAEAALKRRVAPTPIDIDAAAAELQALSLGGVA